MSDLTAVSLFAGIGGFDLALERSGAHVVAAVEINEECRGVLARRFPQTKLFNDVTEVTGDQLRAAGFVPGRGIITGGFPCQDLSVAGRRAGLGGSRSGLFWHIMRLADELRPRWLLLENVPGLLSAVCACPGKGVCVANGRAVRCGEWRGDRDHRDWFPDVPHGVSGGACPGGCMPAHGGAMGTVLGAVGQRGYGFAYRVLDAQFFGVPQRRRRVFIAGCLGDRAAPVQVLLEPESGDGNPAAGGAARAGASGAPGLSAVSALQGGGRRGHRVDAEGAAGGHLIPAVARPLVSGGNDRHDESQMTYVPVAMRGREGGSQIETGQPGEPAFTVRTPGGGSSVPMVAGTLRSHPRPGSADPGAVTVAHAITAREGKGADSDATSGFIVAAPLTSGSATGEGVRAPGRRREDDTNLVTHALTSEGADASEDGSGRGTPLAVVPVAWHGRGMEAGTESIANTLRSAGDGHVGDQMGYIMSLAVAGDFSSSKDVAQAVRSAHGRPGAVGTAEAVRRLTPLECERLQGFPDGWTRFLADGTEQSDSARYRELGNAVAVPCVEWITRRIVAAEAAQATRKQGAA